MKNRAKLWLATSCLLLAFGSGCGQTIVYQTATQPVRLAEPVKALVWVRDSTGTWVKSQNRVVIPEGFDVLPPPTQP